jgi:hypothetical protein
MYIWYIMDDRVLINLFLLVRHPSQWGQVDYDYLYS